MSHARLDGLPVSSQTTPPKHGLGFRLNRVWSTGIMQLVVAFMTLGLLAPCLADTASDQASRALLQMLARETDPKGIQKLAMEISNNYSARKLLKLPQYKAVGQKYFEAWMGTGNMAQRMVALTKAKMGHYPQDVLDRVKLISNQASIDAKKPPMDFDVGPMTYNRHEARVLLDHLGGSAGVERFHKELQQALEEAYLELAQEIGGGGIYVDPKRAFLAATTAWHPEAYGDPKVLLKTGVPSEGLVQQTASVTKYKAWELREAAGKGILSLDEAMEEVARGTVKDADKVQRAFKRMERLLGTKLELPGEVERIIEVYKDLDSMKISPSMADERIRAITGGKFDMFSSAEHIADQMEAVWKGRPRRPQESLLYLFAEFLDDTSYDKAFKAILEGNLDDLPFAARNLIDELDFLAKIRLTQVERSTVRGTLARIEQQKLGNIETLLKNPNSEAMESLMLKIEAGEFDNADILKLFGEKRAKDLASIRAKMTPEIKAKVASKFAKNKWAIWEVDKETSQLLLGNADATLKADAAMGVAMGLWQTAMIMDSNLSPDEESRQIMNAWGTALPIVGDVAQGLIEGAEWAYDDQAPKSKLFKSAAWLSIGAAGLVPGAQAYALVAGLGLMTYELGASYFDISKDKAVIESWLASGVWDEDKGKLKALKDKADRTFVLDDAKPETARKLLAEGDKTYKDGYTDQAIRDSILAHAERAGLDQDEGVQSYLRALRGLYPKYDFKATMRLPMDEAKVAFGEVVRRAGGRPERSAEMLMFIKAKRIYDGAGERAIRVIKAQAEAEYQARRVTGEARATYEALEALGKRLGLPLRQNVEAIFKAFGAYTLEQLKSPWVRESLPRRRVMLAEKYLAGYTQIEKSWLTIAKLFGAAGLPAPRHNLTGYLEIDAPRIQDLEAAYANRAIREARRQVEQSHREASGETVYRFDAQNTCDAELFKTLTNILVRIVDAEDRRLLMQQWAGQRAAAETSRDEKLRAAQQATEEMKKTVTFWNPVHGDKESRLGALPGQLWDGLTNTFSAAYAYANVKWDGTEIYETEAAGIGARIDRLKADYDKAVEQGRKSMQACVRVDLKGMIELSTPKPRKGESFSAKTLLAGTKPPGNATWEWQGSGGVRVMSGVGDNATLVAEGNGGVKATVYNAMKQRIGEFSASVSVREDGEALPAGLKNLSCGNPTGTFDKEPFNGLQLRYGISGLCLGPNKDSEGFTHSRRFDILGVTGDTITVSGSGAPRDASCYTWAGSFWFDTDVSLTVDGQTKAWHSPKPCERKSESSYSVPQPATPFSVSLPVPKDKSQFSVSVSIGQTYVNPRFGNRGLEVGGSGQIVQRVKGSFPEGGEDGVPPAPPLKATLDGPKEAIQVGQKATLTAKAEGGKPPYAYAWSGATGQGPEARFSARKAGEANVEVSVSDSAGQSAKAAHKITVTAPQLGLSGLPGRPVYGASARLGVTGLPGGEGGARYRFVWQASPGLTFTPATSADGATTLTFDRMGSAKVWCEVLVESDGAWVSLAETEQQGIEVIAPTFTMEFNPPSGQGKVGQPIRARVIAKPDVPARLIDYRWLDPAPGNRTETTQNASDIVFTVKDGKPLPLKVLARVPVHGDSIAEVTGAYTGIAYDVRIDAPRTQGPKLQMWVCDTQLGQAQSCGMKDIPQGQFVTFQDIYLKASVTPAPKAPRYRWAIEPPGSCGMPGIGDELRLNCSRTGGYAIKLDVLDADGILLGSAQSNVQVSIAQSDLDKGKKKADATRLIDEAKRLAEQKAYDAAIAKLDAAAALDPALAAAARSQLSRDLAKQAWEARQKGDAAMAVRQLEQATRLDPNNLDARDKLAQARQPAAAGSFDAILRGATYNCAAVEPGSGKRWPCTLRLAGGPAAVSGELSWPSLGSVHRIAGTISGQTLRFTEVAAIQPGGAHLNVDYVLSLSGNTLTGTYLDRNDGSTGTLAVQLDGTAKAAPAPGSSPPPPAPGGQAPPPTWPGAGTTAGTAGGTAGGLGSIARTGADQQVLLGTWTLNGNGYPGKIEFSETGGVLSGRVWYDIYRTWEPLREITFDGRTLRFHRPGPNQWHTGTLSGDSIKGTFDQVGHGTYPWEITRATAAPPGVVTPRLPGTWSINANNYLGKVEFSGGPGAYTGRLWLDAHRVWEELKQVSFDGRTLRFLRPNATQWYTGTVTGDSIKGTFDQGGRGSYLWSITRAGGMAERAATASSSNLARGKPASQSSQSQWSNANDAQGAVDGVINGSFGFHTNNENNPWWQVDLGGPARLDEVRVFNRTEVVPERARTLAILLSDDGRTWRQAYRHDGSVFGGKGDGKPLKVPMQGQVARYVRLQINETNWLHLDEVEVYGQMR